MAGNLPLWLPKASHRLPSSPDEVMPRLTKRFVEAQRADGPELHFDDDLPGFGLRVRKSGAKYLVCQWKRDGRTRRLTLGRFGPLTVEQGRRKALEALAAVARGEDPAEARDAIRADLTVRQAVALWLAEGTGGIKPSTRATYRSGFERHVLPLIGDRKLKSLRRADLERLQDDVAAGKTARTLDGARPRGRIEVKGGRGIAGRVTAYLASVLSWAVRRGLLERSPAEGVRPIVSKRRERYLSAEEFERFGHALAEAEAEGASPVFAAAVRLLALTGMRRNEVLNLRWADLDLAANVIRLPDSKTGAKRVPLAPPAVQLLIQLSARSGRHPAHVFPAARGDGPAVGLRKFMVGIAERAGLEGVTPHVLRHSLASAAAQGGASLFLLSHALGHASTRTTERYSHHHLDPVAAAIAPAAERIATAMEVSGRRAADRRGEPAGDGRSRGVPQDGPACRPRKRRTKNARARGRNAST